MFIMSTYISFLCSSDFSNFLEVLVAFINWNVIFNSLIKALFSPKEYVYQVAWIYLCWLDSAFIPLERGWKATEPIFLCSFCDPMITDPQSHTQSHAQRDTQAFFRFVHIRQIQSLCSHIIQYDDWWSICRHEINQEFCPFNTPF